MRYAIVIERVQGNYSGYVPGLPGCIATGATREEVEAEIRAAIAFHIQGMREDGLAIPEPSSDVEYVTSLRDVTSTPLGDLTRRHLCHCGEAYHLEGVTRDLLRQAGQAASAGLEIGARWYGA